MFVRGYPPHLSGHPAVVLELGFPICPVLFPAFGPCPLLIFSKQVRVITEHPINAPDAAITLTAPVAVVDRAERTQAVSDVVTHHFTTENFIVWTTIRLANSTRSAADRIDVATVQP